MCVSYLLDSAQAPEPPSPFPPLPGPQLLKPSGQYAWESGVGSALPSLLISWNQKPVFIYLCLTFFFFFYKVGAQSYLLIERTDGTEQNEIT